MLGLNTSNHKEFISKMNKISQIIGYQKFGGINFLVFEASSEQDKVRIKNEIELILGRKTDPFKDGHPRDTRTKKYHSNKDYIYWNL
jgi:hypothetical protein